MQDEHHAPERYLIGELAELAGVTPRTIRYYTAEGLLPPPETRGKYARYGPEHLERLRMIARMKEEYLPLAEIRRRLESWGAMTIAPPEPRPGFSGPGLGGESAGPAARPGATQPYPTAEGPRMAVREGQEPFRLTPATPQVGRVEFFPDAQELIGQQGDEPGATRWQRIVIAPGVELHVREPMSEQRWRKIEGVIAGLRDTLRDDEGAL